jgi:hypothetical protein
MAVVYRTIVEESRFAADKEALEVDWRQFDDVFFGLTFTLARDPSQGHETDVPGIFALRTYAWSELRIPLVWYYRFDDQTVTLLGLRRADHEG